MSSDRAAELPYKRVLLKLSGESFCPARENGIKMSVVGKTADELKQVHNAGVELAIVCGGGNILRGKDFSAGQTIVETTAHYMGMLATVLNALALQDALEARGVPTRVQSAIQMDAVAEPYIRRRADRHLEKGRIVILAAGTGGPFVTTDTAAALRGRELGCDIVMKATKVDGVYSDDPEKNPHAIRYPEITFEDVLAQNLKVMDAQAIHHCMEQDMPILVFDFNREGNILSAVRGERVGTIVKS